MSARTKTIDLSGHRFQIRRLPPEAGSFIFMRMMGLQMRSASEAQKTEHTEPPPTSVDAAKLPANIGELRVRALTFAVFSGAISFEDFKFIQKQCMQCVSVIAVREGTEFPLPIMNDQGIWTPDGAVVAGDVKLVMNITAEVLVLCFSDFFAESVPGT